MGQDNINGRNLPSIIGPIINRMEEFIYVFLTVATDNLLPHADGNLCCSVDRNGYRIDLYTYLAYNATFTQIGKLSN